ncbi:26S proteasome non-ATPase regulatory subunit 9 [Paragonimus westermani]|uniref:26S proteasome non-ATPase regulatory subunit 9 n=1 Tax=Paragonimus westermani TaxID=34504 RepID=A0A5J4NDL8_9TREM|nr:26S proteasome non-ATPase regulatory subunit 9 [Paragonimus westermani]
MSDGQASHAELAARISNLSSQKNTIEKEIRSLSEVLAVNGNVGLESSLVDRDGYPRSDIDVVAVRTARNRIIRLNNDHKTVMHDLELTLHQLHQLNREHGSSALRSDETLHTVTKPPTPEDVEPKPVPFLLINEVRPGSVAFDAGLEIGDQVAKFGSVTADNFENMRDISTVLQNTVPHGVIPMIVVRPKRNSRVYHIELTKPDGGVSLGMHIVPLP